MDGYSIAALATLVGSGVALVAAISGVVLRWYAVSTRLLVAVTIAAVTKLGLGPVGPWYFEIGFIPVLAAAYFGLMLVLETGRLHWRHWVLEGTRVTVPLATEEKFWDRWVGHQKRIDQWCQRNCKGRWRYLGDYEYLFSHRSDAAAFRLKWGIADA